MGLRLFGPRPLLDGFAGPPLSAEEREIRRLEAGTAKYGVDLDEERLVVEANLDDAISLDKGCYLGQEVVVRATSRGRVNRRLVGLVIDGRDAPPPRTRLGSPAQAEAGVVTSAVVSARMGGPIALGYVHRAAIDAVSLL
jgi:folate-binding protein YgfZ